MHREALHALLVEHLGLVPEPVASPVSRSYFHERVEWHPSCSTRVIRVLFDPRGQAFNVQLCVSSDNNHTVLMPTPFSESQLRAAVAQEIERLQARWRFR
jgi:hypothetical protein